MTKQLIRRLSVAFVAATAMAAIFASAAMADEYAITEPATEVVGTRATLHAALWTGAQEAGYAFEYGKTTAYGSYTTGKMVKKGGEYEIFVSEKAEGLEPNTLYHYRVGLIKYGDPTVHYGEDLTFKTTAKHTPQFEASRYTAPIGGSEDTGVPAKFVFGEAEAKCETANLSGTLGSASASLSLGAVYGGCKFFGVAATVSMNSCRWVLNVSNAGPPYVGTPSITCNAGDSITFATSSCTLKVPAQALGGSIEFQNQGTGLGQTIHASVSGKGMAFEKVAGKICPGVGTGPASFTSAFTLKATNEVPNGLFLGGEEI